MVLKPVYIQNTIKNGIIWIRELRKIRQKDHNSTITLRDLSDEMSLKKPAFIRYASIFA